MIAEAASDAVRELSRRLEQGEYDTAALAAAWAHEAELFSSDALRFAEFYVYRATALRHADLAILATANTLDDRPANYERFAKILDRRFQGWKAAQRSDTTELPQGSDA